MGDVVVPPVYQEGLPFYNGFASVQLTDRWGTINTHGEMVIQPIFSGPLTFKEGLSKFRGNGDKCGVVDIAGNVVIPPRPGYITYFSDGLACFRDRDVSQSDALYGFVDRTGKQIIPPFFEDARGFSEGLAQSR